MKKLILVLALALLGAVPAVAEDLVFPYGAVYFRKSNPPEEDWERDHKTAAEVGMNVMRHWYMWSAIEVEPGKYDWRNYDRMMELEAQNGIRVVIAEMITAAPEWAFEKYPHARFLGSDDTVVHSSISGSSAVGGFPGLCLDNEDVQAKAEKFLVALVVRYRDHPATLCYDLWNENSFRGGSSSQMYCFCEATQKKFREWLKRSMGRWRYWAGRGIGTATRAGTTCGLRGTFQAIRSRSTGCMWIIFRSTKWFTCPIL